MKKSISKESISYQLCNLMVGKAMQKAEELGIAISISIVDESGVVKFFNRMDYAPLISVDASRKKAITAVGYGIPTGDTWYQFIKDDPILSEGVDSFKDFTLIGGGSPVVIEDQVIGAIGISGGHYKQDEECVNAALSAI